MNDFRVKPATEARLSTISGVPSLSKLKVLTPVAPTSTVSRSAVARIRIVSKGKSIRIICVTGHAPYSATPHVDATAVLAYFVRIKSHLGEAPVGCNVCSRRARYDSHLGSLCGSRFVLHAWRRAWPARDDVPLHNRRWSLVSTGLFNWAPRTFETEMYRPPRHSLHSYLSSHHPLSDH